MTDGLPDTSNLGETQSHVHFRSPPNSALVHAWHDMDWEVDPVSISGLPSAPAEEPLDPSALLPEGERYTIGKELGRGGVGLVVAAHDRRLGRTVAIKHLLSRTPNNTTIRRFLIEAQVTGQLSHPNVINVHDVGTDGEGRLFYSMEFVRGNETLQHLIEQLKAKDRDYHTRFSLQRRVQIMQQVCQAVHYAHLKGVVHRDIKPGNIMVGPFGEVYLLDWGMARIRGRPEEESAPGEAFLPGIDPVLTDPDTVLGTPLYMAPEQFTPAMGASEQTDIYSLSAVLFEFLSLEHYLGDSVKWQELPEVLRSILKVPPMRADRVLKPLNGRVPHALAEVCAKGLEKTPDLRYGTAGELASDLQIWLEGSIPITNCNTCFIRGLSLWQRTLENHPLLVNMATMLGLGVFLVGLVVVGRSILAWLNLF